MELTFQSDMPSKTLHWMRLPAGLGLFSLWLITQLGAVYLANSKGYTGYLLSSSVAAGALVVMAAAWVTRKSTIWPSLTWRFSQRDWMIGSVLVLAVYLAGFAASNLLGNPQEPRMATLFSGLTGLESAALIAVVVIVAPIGEELAFRHFMQGALTYRETTLWHWIAVTLTAIMFTGLHSSYHYKTTLATVFTLALVLGWMRFRSKSIVLLVLLHGQAGLIALGLNQFY